MCRDIQFRRLPEIDPAKLMALMNDPEIRRHLPLASGDFGPAECERFVAAKEEMWQQHGFGPWAFVQHGELIGWGGLQPEGDDADVGLILRPQAWGVGRHLYGKIVKFAFEELELDSVIALLPPTRKRGGGLQRLGFEPDGEVVIGGERFVRFRLWRAGLQ
ncbi:MAG: GNAT family N-acetyltransferase [Acidobacteriota bacterium]